MYCENKNYLLDLYYQEGNEHIQNEIREHVSGCKECREYLDSIGKTMSLLDQLEDNRPHANIFNKVLKEVTDSIPKQYKPRTGFTIIPILQIAFGMLFIFALIYIIKSKLSLSPIWSAIQDYWFVQSIGSLGVSVILVLCLGTFLTLSIAPVLLFESQEKKSFR